MSSVREPHATGNQREEAAALRRDGNWPWVSMLFLRAQVENLRSGKRRPSGAGTVPP